MVLTAFLLRDVILHLGCIFYLICFSRWENKTPEINVYFLVIYLVWFLWKHNREPHKNLGQINWLLSQYHKSRDHFLSDFQFSTVPLFIETSGSETVGHFSHQASAKELFKLLKKFSLTGLDLKTANMLLSALWSTMWYEKKPRVVGWHLKASDFA